MKRKQHQQQRRTGEQNIFRVAQGARVNLFYAFIIGSLASLSSWPASIIEAFMRRKFGERYFTLSTCLSIFIIMLIGGVAMADKIGYAYFITWFIFAGIYLWFSIRHRLEIKKYGTAYDFERFSLCDGRIHKFWWQIIGKEYGGIKVNRYLVHVLLEPAVPVLVGFILIANPYTRAVGTLLMVCGILFAFRSFVKAQSARNSVLDIIDDQITAQYQREVIMEEKPMEETAGLYLPIELPTNPELRGKIADHLEADLNVYDIWEDDEIGDEQGALAYS